MATLEINKTPLNIDDDGNVYISDNNLPELIQAPQTDRNEIMKKKNEQQCINSYKYVNMIFYVILIILISILLNDINAKILNIYYNTKKYNSNIIIKMFMI